VIGCYARSPVSPIAIPLTNAELAQGALNTLSFARPLKLFTANERLMMKRVAILKDEAFKMILSAVIDALQTNVPK
jgi:hypothetical protein